MNSVKTRIVIIGGGAGGLELAARLSRSRIFSHIDLTLVDNKLKHVWKPLLHEVAVGTLSTYEDEVDYIAYAAAHHFHFQYGYVNGINRKSKIASIAQVLNEKGECLLPQREIPYDLLILATGSISNDYGVPGVAQHCLFLDNLNEAENLNKILIQRIIQTLDNQTPDLPFHIAIIGGGATGVELAAELQYVFSEIGKMQKDKILPSHISVIESAPRLLPQMPERISNAVKAYLEKINIQVLTGKRITKVNKDNLEIATGEVIPANIMIWSAGIAADPINRQFDELELTKINQFVVTPTLQTTKDPSIFALGDCANCVLTNKDGKQIIVPPRAQAAHQQAKLLLRSIKCHLQSKPLPIYHYKDYGSLITISKYNIVGNLMSRIAKNLYIEGKFARLTYWWLHKNHQIQLHGLWRVFVLTLANGLAKKIKPKLKLH